MFQLIKGEPFFFNFSSPILLPTIAVNNTYKQIKFDLSVLFKNQIHGLEEYLLTFKDINDAIH